MGEETRQWGSESESSTSDEADRAVRPKRIDNGRIYAPDAYDGGDEDRPPRFIGYKKNSKERRDGCTSVINQRVSEKMRRIKENIEHLWKAVGGSESKERRREGEGDHPQRKRL